MSQVDKPPKPKPPIESDLSQILSHAPACRAAYGLWFGTLIMLVAIAKTRQGALGVATAVGLAMTIVRQVFWK
jgi:hypothetical protein